MGILRFLFFNW